MSGAAGHPISFGTYLRYGSRLRLPATLVTMRVCSVWVWLRYLLAPL